MRTVFELEWTDTEDWVIRVHEYGKDAFDVKESLVVCRSMEAVTSFVKEVLENPRVLDETN